MTTMMTTTVQINWQDPSQREAFFEERYRETFPVVARLISRQHGTYAEAKDIFQDALVILYEKSVQGEAHAIKQPHAYLTGIAKHLWLRNLKSNSKTIAWDDLEAQVVIPADFFEVSHDNRLLSLLERSGKKCMDLLTAFYYDHLSIDKLTTRFGFSDAHSASAQKYKCIDKLRSLVKQKSLHHEDFTE